MNRGVIIALAFFLHILWGQNKLAVLKYDGGGDWYANPSSVNNLIQFCNYHLKTNLASEFDYVKADDPNIFKYPFIHMTGHGNVIFNDMERNQLRTYLLGGGFLHIDDNYGMDKYIRLEIEKIFPDETLTVLPAKHPLFHQFYSFEEGLPKIHEHDDKAPQALAIIIEGDIVLLYTYECDLSDGWENPEVHNDPEALRLKALQMGANIISYAFEGPK